MPILLLAYISDAEKEFSDAEMEELLKTCRKNNSQIDVTGMLLYAGGKFLQILEGDPTTVQDLYAKIESDPRHRNAVVMDTTLSEERHFDEWSMGYQRTSASEVAHELDGYLDVFDGDKLVVKQSPVKRLSISILLNAFKRVVDLKKSAV